MTRWFPNRTVWRIDWPRYIEYLHWRSPGDPEGWHTGTNNGFRWIAYNDRTLIWRSSK